MDKVFRITSSFTSFISLFFLITSSFFIFSKTIEAKVLFFDNFETPSSSQNWEVGRGVWKIENGVYIATASGEATGEKYIFTHTKDGSNWTDYIFEVKMRNIYGVDKVIHFRANEPFDRNNYAINLRDKFGSDGDDLTMDRNLTRDNHIRLIDKFPAPHIAGKWQELRVFAKANEFQIYLNGNFLKEITQQEGATYSGKIGLEVWAEGFPGTIVSYDDVLVAEINTPIHPLNSTVSATPKVIPADGITEGQIVVTLIDFYGQPVNGVFIRCKSSRNSQDIITQPSSSTDLNGQTICIIKSSTPGQSIISIEKDEKHDIEIFKTDKITFTEVPTPTPTPTPFYPVVLIPGHGASFSRDALIYNKPVDQSDWKMMPFIKSYEGIIDTFKNKLGYPANKFYIFYYDWRKEVAKITDDLENFLTNKVAEGNSDLTDNFKTKIVGHSLGGLVARSYGQKYGVSKIDKLVSVGSPHQGAIQAYKAWEGGEVGERNAWQWLALQLLLQLNKRNFQTNVSAIREIAPGTKDLLPIFDYLKWNYSPYEIKPESSMFQRNIWLRDLQTPNSSFFDLFTAIYGEKGNTPEFYRVENRSLIDKALGKWEDGKPVITEFGNGDYTILSKSAKFPEDSAELLNLDHGELIEKSSGIQKILENLGISYSSVSEAPLTIYDPSLLFLLGSPAKLEIKEPDGSITSSDENKLIFIENAKSGDYEVKVAGGSEGDYRLIIGQLTESGDFWSELNGNISTGKEDIYKINFNKDSPLENPLIDEKGNNYLEQARQKLLLLVKEGCDGDLINKAINDINGAINNVDQNQYGKALNSLQEGMNQIFLARKNLTDTTCRNLSYEAVQNLSLAYPPIFNKTGQLINKKNLQKEINKTQNLLSKTRAKLDKAIKNGKASPNQAVSFTLAQENLKKAKKAFSQKNYPYCQILLKVVNFLLTEVVI